MTMRGEKFNTYTTEENMEDRMLNTESGFRYTNQLGEMNRKAKEVKCKLNFLEFHD